MRADWLLKELFHSIMSFITYKGKETTLVIAQHETAAELSQNTQG